MKRKPDLFKDVPEFLTVYNEILKNGFFEELEYKFSSLNGKIAFCIIKGKGYIPNNPNYISEGCLEIVNPKLLIKKVRSIVYKLDNLITKIESKDWQIWNEDENKIIENRGREINFYFSCNFNFKIK